MMLYSSCRDEGFWKLCPVLFLFTAFGQKKNYLQKENTFVVLL